MNPAYVAFANHLWQSTLFAAIAGVLTLLLRNNRARLRHWVWLTASWKFLVPVFGARIAGRSCALADRSAGNPVEFIRCDRRSESALCSASGIIGAGDSTAAGHEHFSGPAMDHLGMRISRHHLFVVDSLAAHPRCRSCRFAGATGFLYPCSVLADSPGAGRLRRLPTGPVAAGRHSRPSYGGTAKRRGRT